MYYNANHSMVWSFMDQSDTALYSSSCKKYSFILIIKSKHTLNKKRPDFDPLPTTYAILFGYASFVPSRAFALL